MSLRTIEMMIVSFVLLMACGCVSGAGVNSDNSYRETYAYCNVYLSAVCFGIASGDEMQMTIPIDYVRYEIKFSDNRNAIIYSGHNPHIENPGLAKKFEACISTKKACSFVHNSDTSFEAIYSRSRQESIVHVVMTEISQTNRKQAREFAENFRPCERVLYDLTCRDQQIFAMQQQRGRR